MARWKPVFKIAGITVPIPDSYSQEIEDLSSDSTGRTLDGVMHKDVVDVKDTTPMTWSRMEWSVAAALTTAVDGLEYTTCEYMDVRSAYTMKSRTIYVGNRKAEPVEFATDGKVYWKVEFSNIEK